MHNGFSSIDWFIFVAYFLVLFLTSVMFSRIKITSSRDYFIGNNSIPLWASAISILATSQSAATFLGGPEYSYSKDMTFIGFYISAFIAVYLVSRYIIPRFYDIKAVTVYELLENRYGASAKKDAGIMFLIGRVFASGARLYIGALAISMIIFMDTSAYDVFISVVILMFGALAYAYFGGIKSIIYSDIIQAVTYIGAGVGIAIYLYMSLNSDISTVITTLYQNDKLKFIDYSIDGSFNIWALMSGWLLLNIAAYGLDQDMTQRALSCKDAKDAQKSMMLSIYMTIPVALLFMIIGLMLYLFYHHPEISNITDKIDQHFNGEKITIFMYYILHQMPDGLKGLVTVGAVAAALSSSNSVLGAMSSVAIEDLYKPWRLQKGFVNEEHFIKAGKVAVVFFAIVLSIMAMLSYYWQHYTNLPLLSFALGVMAFAYSGLIGVYAVALFSHKGNQKSVRYALISGFATVFVLQPYISDIHIGFAWQLLIGSIVSGIVMLTLPLKNG